METTFEEIRVWERALGMAAESLKADGFPYEATALRDLRRRLSYFHPERSHFVDQEIGLPCLLR